MEKTNQEQLAKFKWALNLLGRRIVPYVCGSYDSDKFIQWQFNACRQTAAVVHGFLESQEFPILENKIFVTHLEDPYFGAYDHTFNTCKILLDDWQDLLINVGTTSHQPLVILEYPHKDIFSFRSREAGYPIKCTSTEEVDLKEFEGSNEYYTGLPGEEFVELCLRYLLKYQN